MGSLLSFSLILSLSACVTDSIMSQRVTAHAEAAHSVTTTWDGGFFVFIGQKDSQGGVIS